MIIQKEGATKPKALNWSILTPFKPTKTDGGKQYQRSILNAAPQRAEHRTPRIGITTLYMVDW